MSIQLVGERLTGNVDDLLRPAVLQHRIADRHHQMGLAQSDAAVQKQRITRTTRALLPRKTLPWSPIAARADDKVSEGELVAEGVVGVMARKEIRLTGLGAFPTVVTRFSRVGRATHVRSPLHCVVAGQTGSPGTAGTTGSGRYEVYYASLRQTRADRYDRYISRVSAIWDATLSRDSLDNHSREVTGPCSAINTSWLSPMSWASRRHASKVESLPYSQPDEGSLARQSPRRWVRYKDPSWGRPPWCFSW